MDSSLTPDPAAALRAAGLSPASTFGALLIGYAFASMWVFVVFLKAIKLKFASLDFME